MGDRHHPVFLALALALALLVGDRMRCGFRDVLPKESTG
jgi:hypothetical protein